MKLSGCHRSDTPFHPAMMKMMLSGLLAMALMMSVQATDPPECAALPSSYNRHKLKATSDTVHWGYFWSGNIPKLYVNSGDKVNVEMVTHQAGDFYDYMVKGDPGVEDIFGWGKDKQNVNVRGANGSGDGVHILTGPIYVCGAEPGDILQIDILDLSPRVNPGNGKTYGSNAAATWGYQYRAGALDLKPKEMTTIYELIKDKNGKTMYAVPDVQFQYGSAANGYLGPNGTSCVPSSGVEPMANVERVWNNSAYTFRGVFTPCINGTQKFIGYKYPGLITQHPTGTENYGIRGKYKVPVNLHIGNIGLTPKSPIPVSSIPPMGMTGGNLDNRRMGAGATLYLKVAVPGGLLAMGDAHMAQGDSEFDGTAIETSINGKFRLTLHKAATAPKLVFNLSFPLIENAENYIVQGLSYNDNYLDAPDLQPNPYQQILAAGSSLDKAMMGAYKKGREWLMSAWDLSEDEVNTFITVMCDFQVTQVVDGNWGVHLVIPKFAFEKGTGTPKSHVVCGTSTKLPKCMSMKM